MMGFLTQEIVLTQAKRDDKLLIQHMLQLYLYDFSEFGQEDLNAYGLYDYPYLDHYWTEADRIPFLIHIKNKLAGFALVNQYTYILNTGFSIAEFFILRKYRGKGLGSHIAHKIFDLFGPDWEICQTPENTAATDFWTKTIRDYTKGQYKSYEQGTKDWNGPIQTFCKPNQSQPVD